MPNGKVTATEPAVPVTGNTLEFEVDDGFRFGIAMYGGPLICSINK